MPASLARRQIADKAEITAHDSAGDGKGGAAGEGGQSVAVFARAAAATTPARPAPPLPSLLATLDAHAAFLLWTAIIGAGLLGLPVAWLTIALFARSAAGLAAGLAATAATAWLALAPLPAEGEPPPPAAAALCSYLITRTLAFLHVQADGSPALRVLCAPGADAAIAAAAGAATPLLVVAEPHSVLPLAVLLAFHPAAQPLIHPAHRPPQALVGSRLLASSACFAVPLVRHVWWWLGLRPADRATVRAGLAAAATGAGPPALALCPGGVAEVAFLTPTPPPPLPKTETLFLTARTGFVREALRAGAALLPAFCLGQTALFRWTHPPLLPRPALERLARAIGFMPLWAHNGWGAPLPVRGASLTLLVGGPVEGTAGGSGSGGGGEDSDPSHARVVAVRDRYISDLVGLVRGMQGGVAGEEGTRVVVV